jgi:pimeloyl-ACP methyl ester carboxylesterase
MRTLILGLLLSAAGPQIQDITGNWQGTLGEGTDKIRLVLRIAKEPNASKLYNLDQGSDWGNAQDLTLVTLQGTTFKFKVHSQGDFGAFEGTLNPGAKSITGSWIQGGFRQPITFERPTSKTAWKDSSPHSIRFITVDAGVKLEVLDWGGSGRPMLLLAGNGNTAHVFDSFAGKLATSYHVFGLTRRGFGASSAPSSGYNADRLADDVLEVIHSLKLNKPVVAGHSIAGEELSSIGSRHADKVAGLIYLESGYSYAYYDSTLRDADVDGIQDILATLPQNQRAIWEGRQKYTRIQSPVLAIYAFGQRTDPAPAEAQANAFEKGVPGARVVRFPRAPHYVFIGEEAAVLREVRSFIATLPVR